ncbi:MAG: hypothetical protein HQ541_09340 [Mariniphaga sp.]|nr:hypothetical protein [Mariniphaga sp.]
MVKLVLQGYFINAQVLIKNRIENDRIENSQLPLVKDLALFQYDKHWATHLDYLSEIREGIHLLRLGGQNPLREYQKMADKKFQSTFSEIDTEIQNYLNLIFDKNAADLSELGIKKPSSTWTYIINDYSFGNRLGLMLLDSANIGMQVNPGALLIISLAKLFGLFKKQK